MNRILVAAAALGLVGCTGPASTTAPEPERGDPTGTASDSGLALPPGSFAGVDAEGRPTRLDFAELQRSDRDYGVVVVTGGLWCGTCRWLAAPLEQIVGAETAAHLSRLDLVLGDRDHGSPTEEAARAWQAAGVTAPVGADPEHLTAAFVPKRSPLPLVLVVHAPSLTVVEAMANPTTSTLRERLARRLGVPALPSTRVDGFDENEWSLLQSTTVPVAPPPSPDNPVADDARAIALGEALFFDPGLSPHAVACASCHQEDKHFHNGAPVGEGAATGHRRVPSITLAAHARWQLWDGRAATLAEQALLPIEDDTEMASSRTFVAHRVLTSHRSAYEALFGPAPNSDGWPDAGKPGDAAFDDLPPTQRDAINTVFIRTGQVIAAWERSFRVVPNAFDAYLAGARDALSSEEKYGLRLFVKHGCQQCHWGPRLTDDAFHNVGFPGRAIDGQADPGRAGFVGTDVSNRYLGQFKTPALRGVAHGAFYGHAGRLTDLSEVMEVYGWRANDGEVIAGDPEPWLPSFGETAQWGIVPFLETLTAERQH